MEAKLLESIRNCKTLPVIPVLSIQILSMCQDERADAQKMATLIGHDPAFAAKLLSLSNSGFYARIPHKLTSLTQAVTVIGRDAIAVLALSFSLYRHLRGVEGGGFDHQRFWKRSILASVAGRSLAKWTSHPEGELVFLGALLQDIGMLALSLTLNKTYHEVVTASAASHHRLQELEHERFGCDHSEVGAWLANEWKLPDVFQAVIQGSHNPEGMETLEEFMPMVKLVALSGRVADIWCQPDIEQSAQEAVQVANALLGEGAEMLDAILTGVAEGLPIASAWFEMDLGTTEENDKIIQTAKDVFLKTSGSECSN